MSGETAGFLAGLPNGSPSRPLDLYIRPEGLERVLGLIRGLAGG